MPGAQTVQRDELRGACRALAIFGGAAKASVRLVSDSAYVVGGRRRGAPRNLGRGEQRHCSGFRSRGFFFESDALIYSNKDTQKQIV